jgi:hypothetical protein
LAYDSLLDTSWPEPGMISDWRSWLMEREHEDVANRIRRSTVRGRPCGDESFVKNIENLTGRHLSPQKTGRKPKRGVRPGVSK